MIGTIFLFFIIIKMFKKLLLSIFILPVTIAFGQDTTYLDINKETVQSIDDAAFYRIELEDPQDPARKTESIFYRSGQMFSQKISLDYPGKGILKDYKEWHENGQLKLSSFHKNNVKHGKFMTYWKNGNIKREEGYDDGRMINGKCFDSTGKEIPFFAYEISPTFKGNLIEYLLKNGSPKCLTEFKDEIYVLKKLNDY